MSRPRDARARRLRTGHSLTESALAMVLLGFGVMALGALESRGAQVQQNRERYRTARAIAEDNTRIVENLPHDRLEVTEGFVPAPWLAAPGAAEAEWMVRRDATASEDGLAERYLVSWRVVSVDGSIFLRHIDVRVEWRDTRDRPRRYTLRTVRAI